MKRSDLGIVDALAQLTFVIQGVLGQIAAEYDLSIIQARLLGVLRDRTPGMNELARHLGLDKSSMTGLVDRAERRGLVRRRPSSTDGRGVEVSITPAGRKLVQQAAAVFGQRITELAQPLTATEQASLSALVSRILIEDTRRRGGLLDAMAVDSEPPD